MEFKQLKADYVERSLSPVRVIADEEIIPFPTRNPLFPIKEYKKQLLDDKKRDLGFGHIKLDHSEEVVEEE